MSSTEVEDVEVGFELDGIFYRWSVSDSAKDLMLIDRFTQMPAHTFFELIEDSFDRGRGPILLAMMACSIRRRHADWSVERIHRTVLDLNLSDVTFVGGEDDDDEVEIDTPLEEKKGKKKSGQPSPGSEKLNGSPEPASETSLETQT